MGTITDASEARTGSRPVHFGEGFSDVTTYNGASLGAGAVVEGPGTDRGTLHRGGAGSR